MITEKEIQATLLSPTKKDFYQIWEELLDTANKLSERWDPTSTNQADPGIVLLKVLTACADKLNYNIDKNILEAFMPSASQEESMRKLCSMLGYSMKYYRSATTNAIISYIGEEEMIPDTGIIIPAFTNLKNEDDTINYVTLSSITLGSAITSQKVKVMEGTLKLCEADTDNIISINMIDDNQRYYMPETHIAENGIFVYNINDNTQEMWKQVSNLNVQTSGSKVFKFGFDSRQGIPYLQFPEDISSLIEDGLYIYYIRTNGVNGNISPRTLSTMEKPQLWSEKDFKDIYDGISMDMFSVANADAAQNGTDKETLEDAYNNYRKTIGTFDTLVTCRDYMNKIYQLTFDDNDTTPLVSNVIVSDIRDDINNAITLCSFNDYGIYYVDKPILVEKTIEGPTPTGEKATIVITEPKINNFNLMLYPFKTVRGLNTQTEYDNSFKFTDENVNAIETELKDYKTISHIFTTPDPRSDDIICIKNYLRLDARITTNQKISSNEEKLILNNIKYAIYENFNSRKLDFGEEIPYDKILECIENADERIKNVSLNEPNLYTKFLLANGKEYEVHADASEISDEEKTARSTYNKLALRNILAGKVALFNYDTNFRYSYDETKYPKVIVDEDEKEYSPIYPTTENDQIEKITSNFEMPVPKGTDEDSVTIKDNEILQFRRTNFRSVKTYPAYVNYYLHIERGDGFQEAIPATFINFETYFVDNGDDAKNSFLNTINSKTNTKATEFNCRSSEEFDNLMDTYGYKLYEKIGENKYRNPVKPEEFPEDFKLYSFEIEQNFNIFQTWIKNSNKLPGQEQKLDGNIYRQLPLDTTRISGRFIDVDKYKYVKVNRPETYRGYDNFWIPLTHKADDVSAGVSANGLGIDGKLTTFVKNTEYQLKATEYLLINYTQSETDSEGNETGTKVVNVYYGPNTIIRSATELQDSMEMYDSNIKFNKTGGYSFKLLKNSGDPSDPDTFGSRFGEDPDGMYTLGIDDKIEIREPVSVSLFDEEKKLTTDDEVYLYFILNDEKEKDGYIEFPFGEDVPADLSDVDENPYDDEYTLKEGEYLFYTNKNKLDVAFYGNGTVVKRVCGKDRKLTLKKSTSDEKITEADILEKGTAAIPWIAMHFSKNYYIKLEENQYISLTKGDVLKKLELGADDTGRTTIDSNKWYECTYAKYLIEGEEQDEELSCSEITLGSETYKWRVKTKLEINIGPASPQTLNAGDSITIKYLNNTADETLKGGTRIGDSDGEATSYVPLTIKTNYYAISGSGMLNTQKNLYSMEGKLTGSNENPIKDFKIKTYEKTDVVETISQELINLNNYGNNGWTKLSLNNLVNDYPYTTLHLNIPNIDSTDKRYGIIMIYYVTGLQKEDIEKGENLGASLKIDGEEKLSIFNYPTNKTMSKWTWWENCEQDDKYYLHKGMNIFIIKKSCNLSIYSPKGSGDKNTTSDVVIISQLDIINGTENDNYGIDIDNLQYWNIESNSASEELLKDISKIDKEHEFYYNGPIDNSTALDINKNANPVENLSTPYMWYDYNNANNKFVISEIDSNYLDEGIVTAKSSRLY